MRGIKKKEIVQQWVMTGAYVSRSSPGLSLCTQPKQPRAYIRRNVYVTPPMGFTVLEWDVVLFVSQDSGPC